MHLLHRATTEVLHFANAGAEAALALSFPLITVMDPVAAG